MVECYMLHSGRYRGVCCCRSEGAQQRRPGRRVKETEHTLRVGIGRLQVASGGAACLVHALEAPAVDALRGRLLRQIADAQYGQHRSTPPNPCPSQSLLAQAIVAELTKLGASVEEGHDFCVITPPKEVRFRH